MLARPQPRQALDHRCSRSARVVTVVLGYGITKLKFSTGQDNYLNKSDQVYKDSVAYQKLFGGEAMLTLVTMDPGHTVDELFTPDEHQAVDRPSRARSTTAARSLNVVTPLTALQFNDDARAAARAAT